MFIKIFLSVITTMIIGIVWPKIFSSPSPKDIKKITLLGIGSLAMSLIYQKFVWATMPTFTESVILVLLIWIGFILPTLFINQIMNPNKTNSSQLLTVSSYLLVSLIVMSVIFSW